MKKQSSRVRSIIALHTIRNKSKESFEYIKENSCLNILEDFWNGVKFCASSATARCFKHPKTVPTKHIPKKYAYIFRRKSLWELILLSATVCGIEFCYAAETAFVTPLLLSLGMEIKFVTMIWCLSPFMAFLLTPILGSVSDVCSSRIGRRRPFIIGLSMCIIVGLLLVPYGRQIGIALGDVPSPNNVPPNISSKVDAYGHITSERTHEFHDPLNFHTSYNSEASITSFFHQNNLEELSTVKPSSQKLPPPKSLDDFRTNPKTDNFTEPTSDSTLLVRSVVFTVLGTILVDSCCDICQSPCRAYMLDVSLPKDHATGLGVFSLMAGLGAGLGYVIGAIEWDVPVFGNILEGQVIIVFAIISVVFVIFLIISLCVFPELPLSIFKNPDTHKEYKERYSDTPVQRDNEMNDVGKAQKEAIVLSQVDAVAESNGDCRKALDSAKSIEEELPPGSEEISLTEHLKSIVRMPKSLFRLCLVNFFTWMTSVSYCLYFTDFMGEYVFGGNPHAPQNSPEYILFKDGVRFGCWGMAFASFFCAFYSLFIGTLIKKFGIKFVYISGHVVACIGFIIMVASKNRAAAIIFSSGSGIIYGTAFTIPYLLVARYHSSGMEVFALRGMGTDVAAVTCMMVLSQFIVSLTLGSIADAIGSNAVIIGAAAAASACAAVSAFFVTYPDAKHSI